MKIAVDMMGTDLGIEPILEAIKVFNKRNPNVKFVLVGNQDEIKITKQINEINSNNYEIHHASEVIEMSDGPIAMRRKKDSSMVRAAELLRDDVVDAFVSGGSTAVYLATCHFIIGEIEGIERPGFMPFIPTITKNKAVMMLDVGANLENSAQDLLNYAIMASLYAKVLMSNPNPSVGLLNIGTESSKGKEYHKEAYQLLTNSKDVNFFGNVEPRDITSNIVDIIVTDGYTGNVALKAIEGMAKNLLGVLKKELKKNIIRKLKALMLRKAFHGVKETFDYRSNASALMMGLKKIAIKTHGSSDKKSWISTFEMTKKAIENDFANKIQQAIRNK